MSLKRGYVESAEKVEKTFKPTTKLIKLVKTIRELPPTPPPLITLPQLKFKFQPAGIAKYEDGDVFESEPEPPPYLTSGIKQFIGGHCY